MFLTFFLQYHLPWYQGGFLEPYTNMWLHIIFLQMVLVNHVLDLVLQYHLHIKPLAPVWEWFMQAIFYKLLGDYWDGLSVPFHMHGLSAPFGSRLCLCCQKLAWAIVSDNYLVVPNYPTGRERFRVNVREWTLVAERVHYISRSHTACPMLLQMCESSQTEAHKVCGQHQR